MRVYTVQFGWYCTKTHFRRLQRPATAQCTHAFLAAQTAELLFRGPWTFLVPRPPAPHQIAKWLHCTAPLSGPLANRLEFRLRRPKPTCCSHRPYTMHFDIIWTMRYSQTKAIYQFQGLLSNTSVTWTSTILHELIENELLNFLSFFFLELFFSFMMVCAFYSDKLNYFVKYIRICLDSFEQVVSMKQLQL